LQTIFDPTSDRQHPSAKSNAVVLLNDTGSDEQMDDYVNSVEQHKCTDTYCVYQKHHQSTVANEAEPPTCHFNYLF